MGQVSGGSGYLGGLGGFGGRKYSSSGGIGVRGRYVRVGSGSKSKFDNSIDTSDHSCLCTDKKCEKLSKVIWNNIIKHHGRA